MHQPPPALSTQTAGQAAQVLALYRLLLTMWRPFASGSKNRYYHYGEGSVTHGDELCEHGIGLHHPQIQRTEWPTVWHYLRSRVADWWFGQNMRRLDRAGVFARLREQGQTRSYVADLPSDRLNRFMLWFFGPPWGLNRKSVWAPLHPKDSIYDGAEEEAAEWVRMRAKRKVDESIDSPDR